MLSKGVPCGKPSTVAMSPSAPIAVSFSSARTMRMPSCVSYKRYMEPLNASMRSVVTPLNGAAGRMMRSNISGLPENSNNRLISMTELPVLMLSALAIAADAFVFSQDSSRLSSNSLLPSAATSRRKRKRAFTLPSHHDIFRSQLIDCFAHRALTHTKAHRQIHFARDGSPRCPFPGNQALRQQRLDLPVERLKTGMSKRLFHFSCTKITLGQLNHAAIFKSSVLYLI